MTVSDEHSPNNTQSVPDTVLAKKNHYTLQENTEGSPTVH